VSGWGDPERYLDWRPRPVAGAWLRIGVALALAALVPGLFLSVYGDYVCDECLAIWQSISWQLYLLLGFAPIASVLAFVAWRGWRIAAAALLLIALPVALLGLLAITRPGLPWASTEFSAVPFVLIGFVLNLPGAVALLVGSILTLIGGRFVKPR
jgi:hypothetical protein